MEIQYKMDVDVVGVSPNFGAERGVRNELEKQGTISLVNKTK